ncbi:MAG: 50S ribosomal protein L3 [Candidatus Micrarchaeota archaeon]|nr:50S ribosomal protein L3 [Candidatus Micrarchaeota archaeon]
MGTANQPRHGSLAFRPRRRASSQMPRVTSWPKVGEKVPLGFLGYKAGMTHLAIIDDSHNVTKGQEIIVPVTVVEVPPLLVYGLRAYLSENNYRCSFSDALVSDEKILKPLNLPKNDGLKKIEDNVDVISDVSLLVAVQPSKTGIGKKKAERTEIPVGGKDAKEKLEFCKSLLGKEINFKDVFKPGEYLDIIAVTKGKGWQGPVKRLGVALQRRKATNKRRHVGTLGPWHPAYVMFTTPQAGQMGYHKRTERNKRVFVIGEKPEEINPRGGFPHYGIVKTSYVLLRGSVAGPRKRLIKMRKATRYSGEVHEPQIKYVSLTSKQG